MLRRRRRDGKLWKHEAAEVAFSLLQTFPFVRENQV